MRSLLLRWFKADRPGPHSHSVRARGYKSGVIFTRPEARRIAAGRKTAHRFPQERRTPAVLDCIPVSYRVKAEATGRLCAVEVCRIQVLDVRPALLRDATETEAKAEGFTCRNELLAAWGNPRHPVDCHVIRFRLDRLERPRLLSLRVIAGSQGDYTDNPARALSDEPEAVDDATLAELTALARFKDQQRRSSTAAERAQLPLEEQVRLYTRLARLGHVDIRSELRAIRRWNDPEAQHRQLEKIRAKLEPVAA